MGSRVAISKKFTHNGVELVGAFVGVSFQFPWDPQRCGLSRDLDQEMQNYIWELARPRSPVYLPNHQWLRAFPLSDTKDLEDFVQCGSHLDPRSKVGGKCMNSRPMCRKGLSSERLWQIDSV